MQERLKTVTFNESGQIMLDGKPLEHVKSYRLEKYTQSNEPAELTISMSAMAELELKKDKQRMELMKRDVEDFKKSVCIQRISLMISVICAGLQVIVAIMLAILCHFS